ncbi:MAG: RHS repeat-associated core domain-containing protein, partial [Planctomycetaceae bacterium]|nr:RHS repeat-associated core domain-containing protein [Planctomycetaceae bacterium]
MVELYAFDAYGNALGFDPSVALTEFLYSGEQFDSKIGQQYLRARYYDPATGRFNRLDPFFGNLNDPQSLHKYLYAHNDPINGIDPSGNSLAGVSISIAIGVGIGAIGGGVLGAVRNCALDLPPQTNLFQNMLFGAIIGGVGVVCPWVWYGAAIFATADSLAVLFTTLSDPNTTWQQRTAAFTLVVLSLGATYNSRVYAARFATTSRTLGGNQVFNFKLGIGFISKWPKVIVPEQPNPRFINFLGRLNSDGKKPASWRSGLRPRENPNPDVQISAGGKFDIPIESRTRYLYNVDETGHIRITSDPSPRITGHPALG